MDLNTICIGLLCIPVLYVVYRLYTDPLVLKPTLPQPLWGVQVGKSKLIQSKTGDASLFTQDKRRTATKNAGFARGFMQAAIDFYFITRVCPCTKEVIPLCKCKCCDTLDGGYGDTVFSELYDGGQSGTGFGECTLDGGAVGATNTCDCLEVTGGVADQVGFNALYSGGAANEVFEGCGLDGGVVVHGQTCECCPLVDGGGEGDDYRPGTYSGGGANEVFSGNNIDGGKV